HRGDNTTLLVPPARHSAVARPKPDTTTSRESSDAVSRASRMRLRIAGEVAARPAGGGGPPPPPPGPGAGPGPPPPAPRLRAPATLQKSTPERRRMSSVH